MLAVITVNLRRPVLVATSASLVKRPFPICLQSYWAANRASTFPLPKPHRLGHRIYSRLNHAPLKPYAFLPSRFATVSELISSVNIRLYSRPIPSERYAKATSSKGGSWAADAAFGFAVRPNTSRRRNGGVCATR